MLAKLERERRAVEVRIAGEERWIAAEDAGLYRDALGVPPPGGLPDSFLEPVAGRDARAGRAATRAPTARSRPRSSPAATGSTSTPALKRARARRRAGPRRAAARRQRARVVRRRRPAPGPPRERRRACARRPRRSTRASSPASCPRWQNVDAHRPAGAGPDRLREALVPLQGVALTPEVWERDVLPRRLGAYSPAWLDQLTTGGEIVWIGAGALGAHRAGRALLPRGRPPRRPAAGEREARARPRARSTTRSASGSAPRPSFWLDLVAELERRARGAARGALGPRLGRRGRPTTPSRRCGRGG